MNHLTRSELARRIQTTQVGPLYKVQKGEAMKNGPLFKDVEGHGGPGAPRPPEAYRAK